jgi:type IV secretory pathway VirB4 component
VRFSHTHVLGASGSGKTTLIIKHVKEDIERRDRPAVIVIDPKGTLVDRFSRL